MALKTIPTVFHGDNSGNYEYFKIIDTPSTSGGVSDSQQSVLDLIQQITGTTPDQSTYIQPTPLRFKRQDNDEQDLSNPIPIPSDDGVTNFSFWKSFKLQVGKNVNSESGYLSNLRFYSDVSSWDTGLSISVQMSPTYHPQIDTSSHTSFFQDLQTSDSNFTTPQDLFNYTSTDPLSVVQDIFYYKSQQNNTGTITVGSNTVDGYGTDLDKNLFGDVQPYIYLQISVDNSTSQGNTSQIGIYYRYDEV